MKRILISTKVILILLFYTCSYSFGVTITLRPNKDEYIADFYSGKYWVEFIYDGKIGRVPGSDYKDWVGCCTDLKVYQRTTDYTLQRTIYTDESFYCYQYTYEPTRYYAVGFASDTKQQRVYCYDLDTGKTLWKKDFPVYFDYGWEDQ